MSGFDKAKVEKYLIMPDMATPVSFGYLCEQGHTVNVEGLGSFIFIHTLRR